MKKKELIIILIIVLIIAGVVMSGLLIWQKQNNNNKEKNSNENIVDKYVSEGYLPINIYYSDTSDNDLHPNDYVDIYVNGSSDLLTEEITSQPFIEWAIVGSEPTKDKSLIVYVPRDAYSAMRCATLVSEKNQVSIEIKSTYGTKDSKAIINPVLQNIFEKNICLNVKNN